jgi:hypothetical protein
MNVKNIEDLYSEIEPELDNIMDTIQESSLSQQEMRGVATRIAAYALAMGAAITDEINGVVRDTPPDIELARLFANHVLKSIETNSDQISNDKHKM